MRDQEHFMNNCGWGKDLGPAGYWMPDQHRVMPRLVEALGLEVLPMEDLVGDQKKECIIGVGGSADTSTKRLHGRKLAGGCCQQLQ